MLSQAKEAELRAIAAQRGFDLAKTERFIARKNQQATARAAESADSVAEATQARDNPESSGFLNNSTAGRVLRSGAGGALDALGVLDSSFRTGIQGIAEGNLGLGDGVIGRLIDRNPTTGNELLETFGARPQDLGAVSNIATEVLASPSNLFAGAGLLNRIGPLRRAIQSSPQIANAATTANNLLRSIDEGTNILGAGVRSAGEVLSSIPGNILNRLGVTSDPSIARSVANNRLDAALDKADDASRARNARDLQGTTELADNKDFSTFVRDNDILNKARNQFNETSLDSVNVAVQNELSGLVQRRDEILGLAEQVGGRGKIDEFDIIQNINKQTDKALKGGKLDTRATRREVDNLTRQILTEDLDGKITNVGVNNVLKGFNARFTTNTGSAKKGGEAIVRKALRDTVENAVSNAAKTANNSEASTLAKEFTDAGSQINKTLPGLTANIRKANTSAGRQTITPTDAALAAAAPAAVAGKTAGRVFNNPNLQLATSRVINNAVDNLNTPLFNGTNQLLNPLQGTNSSFLSSNLDRFIRNILEESDSTNNN